MLLSSDVLHASLNELLYVSWSGSQENHSKKHHSLELAVAVASRVLKISGSRRGESTAWWGQLLLMNMKERLKKQNPVIDTILLLKKLQWFLSVYVLPLPVASGTAAAKGKEEKILPNIPKEIN